jgi:hypothetical protein
MEVDQDHEPCWFVISLSIPAMGYEVRELTINKLPAEGTTLI